MRVRWCCVLWTCTFGVGLLLAETIHFTNSPKLVMAARNYTTYELEVPGSKPITIIEATEHFPVGSRRTDSFPSDLQRVGSASTTSIRTSTGISVGRPSEEAQGSAGSRKTLYSPELLNKFLKEYSEKLRNADSTTRKRLNEITMINSVHQKVQSAHQGASMNEYQYRNKGEDHRRPQNQSSADASPEDEAKTEDEFVFDDTHERHGLGAAGGSKRWYQEAPVGYQQHGSSQNRPKDHPWNVKDGWVTLEAVPWSESKVSKWHAATMPEMHKNHPGKGVQSLGNYWSDESVASEETPKYKPTNQPSSSIGASSYYQDDAGDDYYGHGSPYGSKRQPSVRLPSLPPSPTESLYNRRRPAPTPLYGERPDGDNGRPQQADGWYEQHPQTDPYDSMKGYHDQIPTAGPPNRDIITDGRPANFPKYAPEQPMYGYEAVTSPPQSVRGRPVSYPDRGNGEWVLISTTKGYQYPKRRHGQRAITFTPASATSHQTVKLTVLPMKNAVDMTTSHNGLIEVSSSTQTVEEAVKQQKNKIKRHPATTTPTSSVVQRKKKLPSRQQGLAGTFSVMRRDAAQDSSAVLAAVGAGMVPATMAILAPMVLGRKKK